MSTDGSNESAWLVSPERDRELVAERTVAEIGIRLLDDAYSRWRAAESEAAGALAVWLVAAGRSREEAYAAYVAAVDREHAAAHDLQRLREIAEGSLRVRSDVAVAPPT